MISTLSASAAISKSCWRSWRPRRRPKRPLRARDDFCQHPIYYVSHDDATEFCRQLTDLERKAGRLPKGWEYRLPTDEQWEYACRAGTTTATAFGDQLSST